MNRMLVLAYIKDEDNQADMTLAFNFSAFLFPMHEKLQIENSKYMFPDYIEINLN